MNQRLIDIYLAILKLGFKVKECKRQTPYSDAYLVVIEEIGWRYTYVLGPDRIESSSSCLYARRR